MNRITLSQNAWICTDKPPIGFSRTIRASKYEVIQILRSPHYIAPSIYVMTNIYPIWLNRCNHGIEKSFSRLP
jgi:hypothetical protein